MMEVGLTLFAGLSVLREISARVGFIFFRGEGAREGGIVEVHMGENFTVIVNYPTGARRSDLQSLIKS